MAHHPLDPLHPSTAALSAAFAALQAEISALPAQASQASKEATAALSADLDPAREHRLRQALAELGQSLIRLAADKKAEDPEK